MNTSTAVIGGLAALVLIGGLFFYFRGDGLAPTTATSTPTTVTEKVPGKPIAVTSQTVIPTDTTVVFSGNATPNGAFATYWYEFGPTNDLGSKTNTQSIGSGYVSIATPAYLTGLTKMTTYYFRLVTENQFGRTTGSQYSFTTTENVPAPVGGVPAVKTNAATGISANAATLSAEVTPNKAATQQWFEYGKTANLGNTTAFVSVGDGSVVVPLSAAINNLESGVTYFARSNAQNKFGTVNGSIVTFTTSGAAASASAPIAITRAAGTIDRTKATLHGTVAPNGLETSYWFEYSTNAQLNSIELKSTDKQSAGAGMSPVTVEKAADITALTAGTTYYFRVAAQNSKGTVRGDIQTFITK